MKYMTSESSSVQASVANLLEDYDIDIEDYELVKEMKLAYIFKYDGEKDAYVTGTSLGDKKYFDYYLNPRGLELVEKSIDRKSFIDFLRNFKRRASLSLELDSNRENFVFEEYSLAREEFIFLNTRHEEKVEEDFIYLDQEELYRALDEEVIFKYISYKMGDYVVDIDKDLEKSIETLDRYRREVGDYVEDERSPEELERTRESLFRAFLLDHEEMMELLGEEALSKRLVELRKSYEAALRLDRSLRLKDYLNMEDFGQAVEDYKKLIEKQIK